MFKFKIKEEGKKLRDRQKKLNDDLIKKEQQQQELYKISLTKIKQKYGKDGIISVRFPEGLLIPKILNQKLIEVSCNKNKNCQVLNCKNQKKYTDPKTKKDYCSLTCYKLLKTN